MATEKSCEIFISYRRDDTYDEASLIYGELTRHFGDAVFKDDKRIGPGDVFEREILFHLKNAKVVLALIGPKWEMQDEDGCIRLENEADWVRKELEYSVTHNKTLIPVLIKRGEMPAARFLEKCPVLKDPLLSVHYVKVNTRSLDGDLKQLIEETLPGLEIKKRTGAGMEASPFDLLENYPLPEKYKPELEALPPPYVGVTYFTADEAFLFFGRDLDILSLINKVESGESSRKILLYHGLSGVGKSSLLNAGLKPRLDKYWEIPRPKRRNREDGIARGLEDFMGEYSKPSGKYLFVLDQVEEIFTNPSEDQDQEIAAFQKALRRFHQYYQNARLLLSFRSDYFTRVRQLMTDAEEEIPFEEMELLPLNRQGIHEAITGVTQKKELKDLYLLKFDPVSLPNALCEDVLKDKNSSRITPLLQYQLKKLFEKAAPDWEARPKPAQVVISEVHYSPEFRKESLEEMLDQEMALLDRDWGEYRDKGLLLDVLDQYITAQFTAGSRRDEEIFSIYRHVPGFEPFFRFLKDKTAFLVGEKSKDAPPSTRLSHDAIALALRQQYEASDAAAQRARRIFESKKLVDDQGETAIAPIRDPEDIRILELAQPFMRAWTQPEQTAYDQGLKWVKEQEEELLARRVFMFNSFADLGLELCYTLDHEKALEKLEVAVGSDMDLKTKQQKLQAPLEELIYFFAEAGRRPELARKAAGLLLQLAPESAGLQTALESCKLEAWTARAHFTALLQALPTVDVLKKRYYPQMIPLEGGSFKMGSPPEEEGHQSDEDLHEVRLSSFKMASTPVTFYQYALYCEAENKSISHRTPSWGRFGDHPMVYVTWYDAIEFCNWLSRHEALTPCYELLKEANSDKNNRVANDYLKWKATPKRRSKGYRLPTEAEWEYAARGGRKKQTYRFAGSDDPHQVAWFWENSGKAPLSGQWAVDRVMENNCRTHPVKRKDDNGIGLYDLSGNVWEWCWDWYDSEYYGKSEPKDPQGPPFSESGHVLRGGSWYSIGTYCRVPYRDWFYPYLRLYYFGFRLAQGS